MKRWYVARWYEAESLLDQSSSTAYLWVPKIAWIIADSPEEASNDLKLNDLLFCDYYSLTVFELGTEEEYREYLLHLTKKFNELDPTANV